MHESRIKLCERSVCKMLVYEVFRQETCMRDAFVSKPLWKMQGSIIGNLYKDRGRAGSEVKCRRGLGHLNRTDIDHTRLEPMTRDQININDWDLRKWRREIEGKSSLEVYKQWKNNIKDEEKIHNRPAAVGSGLPMHNNQSTLN